MMPYPIFLLIALAIVLVPLLSASLWFIIFSLILPGFKDVTKGILRMDGEPLWKRDIALGASQLFFYMSVMLTVPASAILELFFIIPFILVMGAANPVAQTFSVISAGPIEEIMKWTSAATVYFLIYLSFGRTGKMPDRIRVGIAAGLFSGACFGLVESVGYLTSGTSDLINHGISIRTLDPLIWRMVLGVSVHAMYTGIAAGGLGRFGWGNKFRTTLILLVSSIVLHSLNNGVQGLIVLIMGMDDLFGLILTDSVQMLLALAGFILLSLLWRGILLPSGRVSGGRKRASISISVGL